MICLKLLICGSRTFSDYALLETTVNSFLSSKAVENQNVEIVSGHCRGADQLGEQYADAHCIKVTSFPADWEKYGRSSGIKRNLQMLDYIKDGECAVIAFMSEDSKGTRFTAEKAQKMGIETVVVRY